MFSSWRSALFNWARYVKPVASPRKPFRRRPTIEGLEIRLVPAIVAPTDPGATQQAAAATASAEVQFTVTSDWKSGFGANVVIKNTGTTAINGWTLEFDFPANIDSIWNARVDGRTGNHYTIRNMSYNSTIAPGGTVSFGFNGSPGNLTVKPSNYLLNGLPLGSPTPITPTLSIADVSVSEGNAGSTQANFVVNLSQAATQAITVNFATRNGTATAGSDYVAGTGSITFAPGQTSKTVSVVVQGDTAVESDETFFVTLSSPTGATLARAEATGTIRNDDVPPAVVPTISITNASVAEGDGQTSGSTGFLHTSGNQILDANNQVVRIAGVNWFGFETTNYAPHGLWTRGYKEMMDQMKQLGFNTIRLPFSDQLFEAGSTPNGIDFNKNPDLRNLSGLQIMDKIVDYAGQIGMRIMLDHHRSNAGNSANENGLWYMGSYTEAKWIQNWEMLATRYGNNPTIIGADLHNEPHGPATWGDGSVNDWRLAAERAGNAVLAKAPNWLIVVEGIEGTAAGSTWWGGNLSNAGAAPVRLNVPGRIVYSPHDYPASVYNQTWFSDPNYPNNLPAVWDKYWGYLFRQQNTPILLGEFGSRLATVKDQQWFDKLITYLQGDLDGNGTNDLQSGQQGISWTYWSWNPNSTDTGGILNDDWTTVNQTKITKLQPMQFALSGSGGATNNLATFTVTLSAPTTNTVTVNYATLAGTALEGSDYLGATGTLTFSPGETSKTITVRIVGDKTLEPNENFSVVLSSPANGTIAAGTGTGTIVNDDQVAPTPSLSIADAQIVEGNTGTKVLNFTVTLSAASSTPVTVNYSTANGTASAGSDYTAQTGTLSFAPGATSQTISIVVQGDTAIEADETLLVNLSSASGATVGDAQAVGLITNDDTPPVSADFQFVVQDNWNSGFRADLTIRNPQTTPLTNWTIEFDAPFEIDSIWNARIVSKVGNRYVITSAGWNSTIPPGGSITFGFTAKPGGAVGAPTNYVLTGSA